jgi:hypothetical protein
VTHAFNPRYLGVRDWEDWGSRVWVQSLQDPISTNKRLGMVVHSCCSSSAGSVNRRIMVQDGVGINARPFLKKISKAAYII